MKYPSSFYLLFAPLVSLTQAQGSNDGCITCYLRDLFIDGFDYGLDEIILPAAARFFAPDLPSNPGATNPAQGFVEPQTDPEEERSTDNVPGITEQTDLELQIIDEDPLCNPNAAGACAVATSQIVWPSPFPCGDQVVTSKILASLNQLAPPGGVRSFHNKCGTWFFTASLTPQQIQQLMGENVGIEFIEPDQDAKEDVEILSNDVGKRSLKRSLPEFENQDRQSIARPWRMKKKRALPDFIRMTPNAPAHLAYISTPPGYANPDNVYAVFESAGEKVHVYWIGNNFNPENPDLDGYIYTQRQLMAEDIDPVMDPYSPGYPDVAGCMLSIIGGETFGVLHYGENIENETPHGPTIVFVKVYQRVSSFLSGLETILTDLESRTASGDIIHAYTVIGTSLIVEHDLPGVEEKAAELFERLIQFGVVIVVAAGNDLLPSGRPNYVLIDAWPASFSLNPNTPLIVAGGVSVASGANWSPSAVERPLLRAPHEAICHNAEVVSRIRGTAPSTAIITGLAADMLSREKVRTKLYLDFPEQEPEPERLLNLPVSAKIRNYLDEKSHVRREGRLRFKGVWNGLDPRDSNIANYVA